MASADELRRASAGKDVASAPRARVAQAVVASLGAVAIAVLFVRAGALYEQFPQPAGAGFAVPPAELAFQALYVAFGVPFVGLLGWALALSGVGRRLGVGFSRFARHPRSPLLLALIAAFLSTAFRFAVLECSVVTDDEHAYVFIARTLLLGRVVNPLPEDAHFLVNQFVLVKSTGWYGMYPIGHPLVLAVGLATGTLDVIICLLAAGTAALAWAVARRTLGRRRAVGALLLLVASPHFTWSHATLVSQTTTGFVLMAALAAWLRWAQAGSTRWLAASGFALGFAVLSRPMPGGLFALSVAAVTAWRLRRRGRPLLEAWPLVATLALGVAAVCAVNAAQTGSPFRSPYQQAYTGAYVLAGQPGTVGLSLFGALWRENFWLFGAPLSLLPVLFARPRRERWLLAGPVIMELAYRVLVPKTVLSTTGPVYLLEAVPLLCMLASDGLARLAAAWRRVGGRAGLVPSMVVASLAAALVFFVPVQLRSIQRGVFEYGEVWRQLEGEQVQRAVVFAPYLLRPEQGTWWAFYPPSVSPSFDEPYVFIRWPHGENDPEAAARGFAQRHYPGWPAFLYVPDPPRRLVPLVTGP